MYHGGAQSLFDLVERHYALLYRYAFRLSGSEADAEDLTQQTFLVAQTKLDQLRDAERAKSWLCAILRNVYLKEMRSEACLSAQSLEMLAEPAVQPVKEPEFDSEQLQNVLNDLPEEYRTPLILFYFEEFSYKEIAEQMELPPGTVMSRLSRAKSYLRQRLRAPETVAVQEDQG